MRSTVGVAGAVLLAVIVAAAPMWPSHTPLQPAVPKSSYAVSFGPRPYYIINNMTESPLKKQLKSCENGLFSVTGFSIGHRGGGTLQLPEETNHYYTSIASAGHYDGQLYEVLDVLGRQIGSKGIFSDWSSTISYYANCFGFTGPVGGSY